MLRRYFQCILTASQPPTTPTIETLVTNWLKRAAVLTVFLSLETLRPFQCVCNKYFVIQRLVGPPPRSPRCILAYSVCNTQIMECKAEWRPQRKITTEAAHPAARAFTLTSWWPRRSCEMPNSASSLRANTSVLGL